MTKEKPRSGIIITRSCIKHSGMQEKLNGLTSWQETQNGALKDICKEMKGLRKWVIATLFAIIVATGVFSFLAELYASGLLQKLLESF